MESLSDLLKRMPISAMNEQAAAKSLEIAEDPLITKWRKAYPFIQDYDLKLNMNRFYQYVIEHNNCNHCPGLELCPNDYKGHYSLLTADFVQEKAMIYDQKVSCKKYITKQTQDAIHSRIHSFYVDDRALSVGYSAEEIMDRDVERIESFDKISSYIEITKEEGLQRNGLYLVGSFGTGKTFLMCYLLHELAKTGLTGAIIYMPDFSEDLKAMFGEPQKLKETIDLLKDTDLLIFDDIGAENMNPWLRDHVMGTILNYRMNRKPTFFTSNYELDALEKHFSFTSKDGEEEFKGQRIMDRIRPFVELVHVKGYNKRGNKKA
ncbi:MAG: ATPase [Bacilli bacterium]|nr:ATPase [Bacilli bacterium]